MRAFILATILGTALALFALPAAAQFWRPSALPDAAEFGARIEQGDLAQAKAWLERGLSPEFLGDRIGTGLMIAAWQGNLPMMELFVARGADVNRSNALGEDALMHASLRGQREAAKWLLERGAKLDRGPRRWSALHYAAFSGHAEVAQFLVSRGADLNARSTNGSTPLMMAVYEGHEAAVRQLLQLGADPGLKNDYDEGAMAWAFKHERLAIARLVGSAQEFAAAASRPKADWAAFIRSLPARTEPPPPPAPPPPDQIEELLAVRASLEKRGLNQQVRTLDKRIAYLRARRARPAIEAKRAALVDKRPAVLEISAERKAPGKQSTRLVREPAAGMP